MLFNSTIPEAAFEKERKIVLEEIARDASDPGYAADQFFRRSYYAQSPLSMTVLGTKQSVGGIKRETVLAYYKEYYRPDRMVLLLAGDFDRAAATRALETTFGRGAGNAGRLGAGAAPKRPGPTTPAAPNAPARPGLYREHVEGQRGYLRIGMSAPG